jgi:hypothetical protein
VQRYGKILIKRDKRKTFSLYRHEKPTEAGVHPAFAFMAKIRQPAYKKRNIYKQF